jgi:hypothetical protein
LVGLPFVGVTGTARGIVGSGAVAPTLPGQGDYRFRPMASGWWLAEQR